MVNKILIILGIIIGTAIVSYVIVWFFLQFQKIKLKKEAEKGWMKINHIPEPEKKSWLKRLFTHNGRKNKDISGVTGREQETNGATDPKTA